MYWNRSAADVAAAWQAEIESRLETGTTALLLSGAPDTLLPSVTTLLGIQQSALQRTDVATPMLVVGGNSALWLGLLLPPQATGTYHAPAPTVLYGGADPVSYLAMIGLTTAHAMQPLGISAAFSPRLQPGAATAWEMLPLLEAGEQPIAGTATLGGSMDGAIGGSMGGAASDPAGDWIAWGVMLLALCLVLSALLI